MRRISALLVALLAAAALAGCGGDSGGGKPAAKPVNAPVTTAVDPLDDPAEPERSARRGGRLVADYVDLWTGRLARLPGDGRLRRRMLALRAELARLVRPLRGPKSANYEFLADRMRRLEIPMSETYTALYGNHRKAATLPAPERALWSAINQLDYVLINCWQQTAPGQPWKIPALLHGTHDRLLERAYVLARHRLAS